MADIAKLNVICAYLTELLQSGVAPLAEHSINAINNMINKKLYGDFLDLAESFGESMAFINHNELVNVLLKAWTL